MINDARVGASLPNERRGRRSSFGQNYYCSTWLGRKVGLSYPALGRKVDILVKILMVGIPVAIFIHGLFALRQGYRNLPAHYKPIVELIYGFAMTLFAYYWVVSGRSSQEIFKE
jgi:hypothetical protein